MWDWGRGTGSDQLRALLTPGNLTRKLPRKTVVRVGDTAMFCVELARPEGPVRWLRNQEEVVAGGRVAITVEGTCHTLTISRCNLDDMGEVAFVAGDCRTSTQFCVSGKGLGIAGGGTHPFQPAPLGPTALACCKEGCMEGVTAVPALSPRIPGLLALSFTVVTLVVCSEEVLVVPPTSNQREGADCSRSRACVWGIMCDHVLFLRPLVSSL